MIHLLTVLASLQCSNQGKYKKSLKRLTVSSVVKDSLEIYSKERNWNNVKYVCKKYCLKLYNNGENGNKADGKEVRRNLHTIIWRNTMQLFKRMFKKSFL